MANEYAVNQADMQAVADAIRSKGGTNEPLAFPGGFVDALAAIQAGGGGLPYWHGQITLTSTSPWFYIDHGLGSDKLIIVLDALDYPAEVEKNAYTLYRLIAWSSELLAPHIRFPVGDKTNTPYIDENLGESFLRTANVGTSSGAGTATQFQISTANRPGDAASNGGMIHSAENNRTLLSTNRTFYYPTTFNVTVIDISHCGIRYTEED